MTVALIGRLVAFVMTALLGLLVLGALAAGGLGTGDLFQVDPGLLGP